VAGKDYDDRVQMPLNLDNELLFDLMKRAHEQDITLNQMIEQALRAAIEQHEKNS
jgi:predicted HicB family RNase H-like nuclease